MADLDPARVDHVRVDRTAASEPARPERFSGTVRIQELQATRENVQVLAVFFDAGARTRPHIHVSDQVLVGIEGEGVVAAGDGDMDTRRIAAGDTARIPGGTWHWHGATRTTALTHLSILVPSDGDRWDDVEERDWAAYHDGSD